MSETHHKPAEIAAYTEDTSNETVAPIFRLGDDLYSTEVITGSVRILSWDLRGDEQKLDDIAGWSTFPHRYEQGKGYLQLPNGTRNAPSVLAGTEAWAGEKQAIVDRAAEYLVEAQAVAGLGQLGFSWAQVGITPDHTIFVAPPHTVANPAEEEPATATIIDGLSALLENDPQNQNLIEHFADKLRGAEHVTRS